MLDNWATVGASNEASSFSSNNQAEAKITIVNNAVTEGASHTFDMGTYTSSKTGTASVDINWGDTSTDTTYTFAYNTANVLVPLASQDHTYGEEGTYTVTETVTLGGVATTSTFTVNVTDPAVIARDTRQHDHEDLQRPGRR